ncbi:MAG: hypothetical protein GXY76_22780 [Chloroflexi bacterium]|nr:hypothetical protein [Chloroflexota bacterium]
MNQHNAEWLHDIVGRMTPRDQPERRDEQAQTDPYRKLVEARQAEELAHHRSCPLASRHQPLLAGR